MTRALGIVAIFLVGVSLAGCSDAPAPITPDTGPGIDVGTRCRTDAECSDGHFCNGAERCLAGSDASGTDARGCAPAATTNPCTTGQTCDETAGRCLNGCPDADGDGHMATSCGGDDCDDTDPDRYPGNTEVCTYSAAMMLRIDPTHDEDCNPMTYANGTVGDGDQDADGYVDRDCLNRDTNGNTIRGNDCADLLPVAAMAPFTMPVPAANVHPTEGEHCNGVDDDCNGIVDDGLSVNTYYPDCDGDLFGDMTATGMVGCDPNLLGTCMGHAPVAEHSDCNDASPTVHMGLTDVCDGIDNDCNGTIDDAAPADASCTMMFPTTPHGTVTCAMGACALTCATNYGNCDGAIPTGCEIDTRTDRAHCGTCATSCGLAAACTAGACEGITNIDAGPAHTCALYASGHAVCWGRNNEGQLGDGTRTDRSMAVPVAPPVGGTLQRFAYLEAGGLRTEVGATLNDQSHTCAATTTGWYCWGRGNEGQLGNSATASSNAPVAVATLPYSQPTDTGLPLVLGVTVGGLHSFAWQREPRLGPPLYSRWGWGNNTFLELGLASPTTTSVPLQSGGSVEIDAVAAGPRHTCWVSGLNGSVNCFGSNTFAEAPATAPIGAGQWAHDVSAGGIMGSGTSGTFTQTNSAFTCATIPPALAGPGPMICWGANGQGQLGNGGTAGANVMGLTDVVFSGYDTGLHVIAAGGRHACAVRATGAVACWGHNLYGQLGNGTRTDSNRPVMVSGITTAIAVAAGAEHSCAVLANGSVRCWGRNDHGQLGNGTTTDSTTPVTVLGL